MIWPGLPAFLVQFALGLCRPLPVHMPAWYSYGGIIAPAMPIYDSAAYPNAVMVCEDPGLYDGRNCTLYLFSGIPAVEDGDFKAWETDLNVMVFRVRGNVWKKESAFTLPLDGSTKAQYTNFVWANFDLYTLDAQLLVSASDPLPATDYTTTLFEGDVTTVAGDYIITSPNGTEYPQTFNGAHAVISDGALFDDYGLIRLTVDEVPVGYKIQSMMLGSYVGNQWLLDVEKQDTGGSFAVMPVLLSGETLLLSREPGTYHVKVEKIERRAAQKEPVAQQWETLFEGEVTVDSKEFSTDFGYSCYLSHDTMFAPNDGIRFTVDGKSSVYTAIDKTGDGYTTTAIFGNEWFHGGYDGNDYADDGTDFYVRTGYLLSPYTSFQARTPGTYQIKIERALFEPVAYLYNGVRLPALPVTNKPYVCIFKWHFGKTRVMFLPNPPVTFTSNGGVYHGVLTGETEVPFLMYDIADGSDSWELIFDKTGTPSCGLSQTIWANYDILDADGNIHIAASEPVPVYE